MARRLEQPALAARALLQRLQEAPDDREALVGISRAFSARACLFNGDATQPVQAQALAERGGTEMVGLYLALAGVVSWLGLLMVRKDAAKQA